MPTPSSGGLTLVEVETDNHTWCTCQHWVLYCICVGLVCENCTDHCNSTGIEFTQGSFVCCMYELLGRLC